MLLLNATRRKTGWRNRVLPLILPLTLPLLAVAFGGNASAATCTTASASNGWINASLATETGQFTANWDATPSAANIDSVVTLSSAAATAYSKSAILVRFNPSGQIDARNGAAYAAASVINYAAGSTYHFRIVANVATHTYSAYVTPAGQAESIVGVNFAFRSEQSAVTKLNDWAVVVDPAGASGTNTVCNFALVVTIAISPTSATIQSGATQQFIPSIHGAKNRAVTWSATGGTISTSGLYTAGATSGSFTAKATSVQDPTKSATATITIPAAQQVTVNISPTTATAQPSATQQFAATVTGTANTAVTWSATGGTISTSGLYTAGATSGAFTAKATSVQDPTKSAAATITIATQTTTAHPRIILDAPTLATLRGRAQANTAQWTALKAVCDSYTTGGTVNFPGQNGYPNRPSVGEGYQGDGYFDVLLPLGLCYQSTILSDPTTAAKYGSKAVAILAAMSDPAHQSISGTPVWDRDNGYGIRNYGVAMGIGYDWFHDLLSTAQQTQIQTALGHWFTGFENDSADDFEYAHPQSNYFAGYYSAKCMGALAVQGDSPLGDTWWNDWYNNQHLQRVAPYYTANLTGGGWPEGFAAYGPLATRNQSLPTLAVRSAKGIDLIHAAQPYSFPLDQGRWLMQFTWPTRDFIDDRGTVHSINSDTIWPGTGDPNTYTFLAGFLAMWNDPAAPMMHKYARDAKAALARLGAGTPDEWIEFLFWDDTAPETSDYSSLPLSYFAPGMSQVAARSDWTLGATWMSFTSGPYVNNPSQGEQHFDSGSIALVKDKNPLLVNPEGWFAHNPNGTAGENAVFDDIYGNWDANHAVGNRVLYNNFQVRHVDAQGRVLDHYGQWALQRSDGVRTKIGHYEDGGSYVLAVGQFLEDMYRPFQTICAGQSPITTSSRQVVYLRPSQFVVYDRTQICDASLDQYLAFHFAANPVETAAPAPGLHRFDVNTGSFAGSMTTLLPANAATTTTDRLSTDSSTWGRVWRTEVRPTDAPAATRRWMTVFDLSATASEVANATTLTIAGGAAVGALLQSPTGNSVVVSGIAPAGTPIAGPLGYTVPAAATRHVITDLTPAAGYTITVNAAGATHTLNITPGGPSNSSANGVLTFQVSPSGQITP